MDAKRGSWELEERTWRAPSRKRWEWRDKRFGSCELSCGSICSGVGGGPLLSIRMALKACPIKGFCLHSSTLMDVQAGDSRVRQSSREVSMQNIC